MMHYKHNHQKARPCTLTCPAKNAHTMALPGDTESWFDPFADTDEPTGALGLAAELSATDGDAIVEARRNVYGDPTATYVRVAAIMSAILDHEVQPWQAPLLMVAVKLVRTAETPDYSDNSDDIDGYMKMFREIMGDDMVKAKSVAEYLAFKEGIES